MLLELFRMFLVNPQLCGIVHSTGQDNAWADLPGSKAQERQSTFSTQGLSRTNSLCTLLSVTTPQMATLCSTPGSSMMSFYHLSPILKFKQAELKQDLKMYTDLTSSDCGWVMQNTLINSNLWQIHSCSHSADELFFLLFL